MKIGFKTRIVGYSNLLFLALLFVFASISFYVIQDYGYICTKVQNTTRDLKIA